MSHGFRAQRRWFADSITEMIFDVRISTMWSKMQGMRCWEKSWSWSCSRSCWGDQDQD